MDYQLEEISRPLAIFILMVLGLMLSGLVEARVERRHPDELSRLGGGRVLVPPSADSFRRFWAWFRFALVEHFRLGDPALSILCLLNVAVVIAFALAMTIPG